MPTKKEREYYRMGFRDGLKLDERETDLRSVAPSYQVLPKIKAKRKLNSWQKFVKANSNKRKFRFKDGKLKLKSMGIAYRKTAAYKRSKK